MLGIASAVERQLIFSKISGDIYVQTDDKHYAFYGQTKDEDGIRVIRVTEDSYYYQKSNCERFRKDLDRVDGKELNKHVLIRGNWLAEKRGPETSPGSYTWSHNFSDGEKKFSVIRLDTKTVVYCSAHFPGDLAIVIITGNVVIFAHYDGNITLKTRNCLYNNEKILLAGIDQIDINKGDKVGLFGSSGDKPLKKHIKLYPISELGFGLEQDYYATYTAEDRANIQRVPNG